MATGIKAAAWAATGLAIALAATTATAVRAADDKPAAPAAPTSKPAADGAHAGRHRKLFEPYGSMKSLTPDQVQKIEKVHADALEQEKKIKQKEQDDIDALLTPAQRDELKAVQDGKKEAAKEKSAARRKPGDMATTKPAAK